MTCKDCVHYDVCKYNTYQQARYFGKDKEIYITIDNNTPCKFFKNKANVLEIPDTDIIYTKDKWLVLNMESEHLGGAIKSIIDYCTKNARSENNGR